MIVNGKKKYNEIYKNNYRINLGIQLLRMLLCFWVITFHFSGRINKKRKIIKTVFHVPTFMFISFYLSYNIFFTQNLIKIKNRLQRLVIPYIIIPIIDIGIKIGLSFTKLISNIKIIFFDLLLQYITGYKTYINFWFIQNMIILTIIFEIIFYFLKKKSTVIIILLIIICYWAQYSEINYCIFSKYEAYFRAVSRLAEMMPIASTGIILSSIKLLKQLENHKLYSLFFCFVILYFTYNYNIFGGFRGFLYNGIKQNIASICLFIFFSLIPLQIINNNIYFNCIKIITNHTGGIYYFQTISKFLLRNIIYLRFHPLFSCFIIYLLGYFISFLGTIIFKKIKFKYLFN